MRRGGPPTAWGGLQGRREHRSEGWLSVWQVGRDHGFEAGRRWRTEHAAEGEGGHNFTPPAGPPTQSFAGKTRKRRKRGRLQHSEAQRR